MSDLIAKKGSSSLDLTILVNSCDLYEDAWDPFFRLLKKQWPECERYDIILNTETKTYDCDFLNVRTVCTGKDIPWTERVKQLVLKEIKTNNILMFLEDFFIFQPVNNDIFDEVLSAFVEDKKIGTTWFSNRKELFPNNKNSKEYNKYFRYLSKHFISRVNLSISLWKKEYMLKMLFSEGTPWYFENCARTISILLNHKYIPTTMEYDLSLIFGVDHDRYGITKKKWLPANRELFAEHGISVDFSNMGIFDDDLDLFSIQKRIDEENGIKTKKRPKGISRLFWYLKRNFKFCKRSLHILPSLHRYCKMIDGFIAESE